MISSLEALAALVALTVFFPARSPSLEKEDRPGSDVDGQPGERVGIKQMDGNPIPSQCVAHGTRR